MINRNILDEHNRIQDQIKTTKLNLTVEELAELIRERLKEDFTFDKNSVVGCARLDKEALAQARRVLAALEGDGLTPHQRAADALYDACHSAASLIIYQNTHSAGGDSAATLRTVRAALAQAEGKVE